MTSNQQAVPSTAASATDQHLAGATAPGALDRDAGARARLARPTDRACSSSQRGNLAGGEPGTGHLEARVVDLLLRLQRLEQPVAEHPELQPVEQGVDLVAVPRLDGEVGRAEVEVEVADQRVEAAVADHVAEVLAERLALLAGDLVGVGDDVVEAVELVDPLRGVALAHARARRAGCRRSRPRSPRARGSAAGGTP